MAKKLELLKFDKHIGVYDPKKKERLKNLCSKKRVKVRVKASAFEGGYNEYYTGDLHKKLMRKKTISESEYKKLQKNYKC